MKNKQNKKGKTQRPKVKVRLIIEDKLISKLSKIDLELKVSTHKK